MVPEFILAAKDRISEQLNNGKNPVIVVSALKGVTDELLLFYNLLKDKIKRNQKIGRSSEKYVEKLINPFLLGLRQKHADMMNHAQIGQEEQKKILLELDKTLDNLKSDLMVVIRFGSLTIFQDKILAYGEKLASIFFSGFLSSNNISADYIFAEEIPIVTDSKYSNANIDYEVSEQGLKKIFHDQKGVIVIPGFTGKNIEGNITTLGRGGTDTTACFVAAALRAEKVILWKDVPGVLSADPKIVPEAKTVEYVSYAEAEESGKVIHDKAIQYVKMHETEAEVASIVDPEKKTIVGPESSGNKGAKMISFKKGLYLILITDEGMSEYGFLNGITKIFNDYEINMVLIRNTRDSLQIVVEENNGELEKALLELREKDYGIIDSPVNMVTLIGSLDWKMVNTFNDALISMCPDAQIGAFPYKDCIRLEAIVKTEEMEKVIRGFHKIFIK